MHTEMLIHSVACEKEGCLCCYIVLSVGVRVARLLKVEGPVFLVKIVAFYYAQEV